MSKLAVAARGVVLAGVLLIAAPPVDAHAQGAAAPEPVAPVVLVPHRAIYDLSLARTRGISSIVGVRGRIIYDFSGNTCDGYKLAFRQVSELDNGQGKVSTNDLRSTTWEGANAKSFKFDSQNFLGERLIDNVDGRADHDAKKTQISLRKPDRKSFSLSPNVVFPTEHMVRAIEAGRAGKHILSFPVYDGSENGAKVFNTLTVIGNTIAPGGRQHNDAAARVPQLADVPRWPVTISYFSADKNPQSAEQTPDYTISFELYANGISRALSLDYNDFVVSGKLVSLKLGQAKPCR